ncbi:MAG TPA: orotidine 5'-phosphate decarboxylase / HUMPS family protein [Chthonomonadaceae bacterium]|nr:orotidine 5'-phosphate decarboxylase / HUMPS family protein [Chthonomonadaceae bacterium]
MEQLPITAPIIQAAIDVLTIDEALRIGEACVRAGVDWLEVGTPLITFAGVQAIGALARAFPETPVLADYKMMDGVRKYVVETAKQGGRLCTICAVASDASIREAVRAANESGVTLISDLYACPDVAGRAVELRDMGVHSVYVHWGADQRKEMPERDALRDLHGVVAHAHIPVGVGTFSVEDGVRAFQGGASIAVVGVPLIQEADVKAAFREYVLRAREAYAARQKVASAP